MDKDNGETLDGLRRDLPAWARHLSQPRDPEDGFLLPRRCGLVGSGHTPNVVQIKVCLRDTPRKGKLLGVEDNVISVDSETRSCVTAITSPNDSSKSSALEAQYESSLPFSNEGQDYCFCIRRR